MFSANFATTLDPDTGDFRADFEDAYRSADVRGMPRGSDRAAARVEAILREKYPEARVFVESGPAWMVVARP